MSFENSHILYRYCLLYSPLINWGIRVFINVNNAIGVILSGYIPVPALLPGTHRSCSAYQILRPESADRPRNGRRSPVPHPTRYPAVWQSTQSHGYIFFEAKSGLRSYFHTPFFHHGKEVVYDIFPALGVQHFILRHDVAVQNIAFFGKCPIDTLCIHAKLCGNIFYAEYCKFKLSGIFDFLVRHHK